MWDCVFSIEPFALPCRLWRLPMLCPLCRPRSPSFSVGGDGGGEYLSSIASLLSSDHICDGPLLLAHLELIEKRRSRGLDACVIKRTEKPLHCTLEHFLICMLRLWQVMFLFWFSQDAATRRPLRWTSYVLQSYKPLKRVEANRRQHRSATYFITFAMSEGAKCR